MLGNQLLNAHWPHAFTLRKVLLRILAWSLSTISFSSYLSLFKNCKLQRTFNSIPGVENVKRQMNNWKFSSIINYRPFLPALSNLRTIVGNSEKRRCENYRCFGMKWNAKFCFWKEKKLIVWWRTVKSWNSLRTILVKLILKWWLSLWYSRKKCCSSVYMEILMILTVFLE